MRFHLIPRNAFPAEDETLAEITVLSHVLGECPEGTMLPELLRQMFAEEATGTEREAVESAVRRLVARGALRMQGERVVADHPSSAHPLRTSGDSQHGGPRHQGGDDERR